MATPHPQNLPPSTDMKIEIPTPDLDIGERIVDPKELAEIHRRLAGEGRIPIGEEGSQEAGRPVFLLRLSMAASRHLVKNCSSPREEFSINSHHDFLHHCAIDRSLDGWAHWINTVYVPDHLR